MTYIMKHLLWLKVILEIAFPSVRNSFFIHISVRGLVFKINSSIFGNKYADTASVQSKIVPVKNSI